MKFTFHRKLKLIGWLALFIFLLGTISAQGQNMLKNPGFEEMADSWDDWGGNAFSTTTVRSGVNAISHTGEGGLAQTVLNGIVVGDSYTLSTWTIFPDGNDGSGDAAIGIQFYDADAVKIGQVEVDLIRNTEDFQLNTLKFTVTEETAGIVVFLWATTSLIVDDFSLTKDVELPEPVLVNPGFETELSNGWDQDMGFAVRDEVAARSGIYGLKVGGAGDGGRGQMIDLTPGSSHTLTVWAKIVGTGLDAIKSYAGVEFKDAGGAIISAPEVVFTDTSDWKQYYLSFTVPSNAASSQIFTSLEAAGTDNVVYTDDYELFAAVPVSGLTLTPETTSIPLGLVEQLKASIEPSSAINQQLIWSSSDTAVAEVSSSGLVQAKKEGSATISVVSVEGAFSKSCEVTVGPRTGNLILNPGFEKNLTNWGDWDGVSEITTEKYHSGSSSLVVGPGTGGRYQDIDGLVPGGTYTLSAWVLMEGDIEVQNASIGLYHLKLYTWIVESDDFYQASLTFTVPMDKTGITIYCWNNYIDEKDNTLLTDDWGLVSGWEPMPFVISSDASATSIMVMPGRLSSKFSPDVNTYNATVPEGTTTVSVKAAASDPGAIITGGGNIDVSSGSATVEIVITAEDGITTKTYTIKITVESSVGIMDKEATQLSLYPNPVSAGNIFHLEGLQGGESVSILDMTGRVVFTEKLQGSDHELIQLNEQITIGTYIVKVSGRSGVHTQLLIVK